MINGPPPKFHGTRDILHSAPRHDYVNGGVGDDDFCEAETESNCERSHRRQSELCRSSRSGLIPCARPQPACRSSPPSDCAVTGSWPA